MRSCRDGQLTVSLTRILPSHGRAAGMAAFTRVLARRQGPYR